MYDMKTARQLGTRYEDYIANTIRSPKFEERDERTVRGMFVAARRAIVLKQSARLSLIQEQLAIVKRSNKRGAGWNNHDRAEWNHTNALLDHMDESLVLTASMVSVIALMLDDVTTHETRAPLLKLHRPDLVPDGATTLQAIMCGIASDVAVWVERMAHSVSEKRWDAAAKPLIAHEVAIIEKHLYRKLPRERSHSFDAMWRAVPVNEFIRLRRDLRKRDATLKSLLMDRKMADHTIRKLGREKPLGPESAAKITTARVLSTAYAEQIESVRNSIDALADTMVENVHRLDAVLNLQEKCELFNVNVADRGELDEGTTSASILGGSSLEDSAEHRGERGMLNHPVGAHFFIAIIRSIRRHPGGQEILDEGVREFFPNGHLASLDAKVLWDGSVLVGGENTGIKAIPVEHAAEAEKQIAAPRVLH